MENQQQQCLKGKCRPIILILYVLISAIYILWTFWSYFKINIMQSSYLQGKTETVQSLIKEATKPGCQPFSVFIGENNKVDLINVACLQQQKTAESK